MDDKRKKLLELMEELSFPLTKEEATEKVGMLTDDEVSNLVSVYSEIADSDNALEEYVQENAPEEYEKLIKERDQKIKKKDHELNSEMEKFQEDGDIKLDSLSAKEERQIDEIVQEEEKEAEAVEEISRDLQEVFSDDRISTTNTVSRNN